MIPIKGTITGVRETLAAFEQIPGLLRQAGMAAMTESLGHLSQIIRDDYLQGPYPFQIERRSGSFRATFARGHADNIWQVSATGTQVIGTFGSQDKRARILNDGTGYLPGGVLRSSRPGGYLAIRTEFTKTPNGVVRAKYQQPLRTLPNTFIAKHTVFERIGKRIIPIAWLKKEVRIEGRRFMEQGSRRATPGIQALFRTRFETVLSRLQQALSRIRGA